MRKPYPSSRRVSVHPGNILILLFTLILATSAAARAKHKPAAKARPAQTVTSGPKIWLADAQSLRVSHVAARPSAQSVAQSLATGQGQPLSMVNGDFDGDGVEDLVIGYVTPAGSAIVLHRGDLDAFAPQSEASRQGIAYGQFPAPFLEQAQVLDIPVRPDFIAAGNFAGNGNQDLAFASSGGTTLYILPNDGKGNFGAPQTVSLPGGVTALGAGSWGSSQALTDLVLGVSSSGKFSLLVLGDTGVGLGIVANYPVSGPVSNILFGQFGDSRPDVAFLSGGQIEILRSANMQLAPVLLPVSVRAFALGGFIHDRNPNVQIALLASDGSVQIAAHNEFDPRTYSVQELSALRKAAALRTRPNPLLPKQTFPVSGWRILESFPAVASLSPDQPAVFFRARVSSHGADDVMLVNPSSGQLVVISHPNLPQGAATFLPGQVSLRPYSGTPVAALPMRVNISSRPGVIAIHRNETAPSAIFPIPDPTIFVNRTDDPVPNATSGASTCTNTSATDTSVSCSLREAILKSNGDTVMLQAATYTLTQPRVSGDFTGQHGTLEIVNDTDILGATDGSGNPASIIQAGTNATNGVDKIMSINQDILVSTTASASLTNLVLQFGFNRGDVTETDGYGGAFDFDVDNSGATVTVTNCVLQNNSVHSGQGGGITVFNTGGNASTTGSLQISNSTIQNNSVTPDSSGAGGDAGGIEIDFQAHMTLNNVQVLNNSANFNATEAGTGGGIRIDGDGGTSARSVIHGGKIQGNTAAGDGGGILNQAALTIDTETVISGNTAGGDGGGIWNNTSLSDTATLSKVTIINNAATGSCSTCDGGSSGNGGGIFTGNNNGNQPITMSFSRLAGNTAHASGSNLYNDDTPITAATDNWWGTNTPASTITNANGGTTTFDPFIVLSNTATPNLLRIGDTSTVTASFLQDDHGTAIAASNLNVLLGLPTSGSIFSGSPAHGTLSNVQTTIQANGEATETYTATSGGIDTIDAVIDSATVPATITVLSPPSIAKAFNVTHIPVFTFSPVTSTLTFTITNSNTANALHGLAFTDNLPSGLAVANTPGVTNTCAGTATATAGSGTITLSGGTVNQNTNCTVAVNVKGVSDGVQNNTSSDVTATDAGGLTSASPATASITVINPPSITKSFAPTSISVGATSTLTLTVSNSNANSTLNGLAFTDTFPAGMIVATPSNLSSTCSGTASGGSGSTSVSLSGATLSPGATCTVSASVKGSVGVFNNSVNATSTDVGGLTGPTSTASLTVTQATTTTAVASSSNPSAFGQAITFTATVTDTSAGSTAQPTGSVQFVVDGVNFGSPVALTGASSNSSTATSQATATLSVAGSPHTVAVNYTNADGNFMNSAGSLTGGQTVTPASTTTVVISSQDPSTFGHAVTFTAVITDVFAGSTAQPTGAVQFVIDGVNFGSPVVLTGNSSNSSVAGSQATATLSVSGSPHTVTANYINADGNFTNSSGAVLGGQLVNPASTTTSVNSSQNPSTFGAPITFTATVTNVSTSPAPTGAVQFVVDGVNFGSPVTLTSGGGNSSTAASQVTSTLSVAGSPHSVTVNYINADGNFTNSSGTLTPGQTVTATTTTTAVTSSQGTITLGDTVTFTGTVTATSGTPTGLVTFFDGNTPLGSGSLQLVAGNSQATFSTSLLSAAGSPHSITATYQGSAAFAASTSAAISETVNPRTSATGVALNPTSVVVGQSSTATVTVTDSGSVPPGTADTFTTTGAPATGRTGFTSTLFADGLLLAAGGTDANNNVLNTAEIYSVSSGTFSTTGNLNTARTGAVAVLLPSGKVLVAGGSSDGTANGALNTAELFDPGAGTFAVAGSGSGNTMTAARFGTTATLLNTGKVLLAGGENSGGVLNSAELYDPATDTFTATGNLNSARTGASAILLGTGKVLLAGGSSDGTANGALDSAEVFDPAGNSGAGTFTSVAGANPTLAAARWLPEAALLLSGKVFIAGGENSGGALTSADLYDPVADSFTPSNGNMAQARANGSAVALPSGMVLLAGGTTSQTVDLYDADSDRFNTTGSLQQSDAGLLSTLLNNGQVLGVGLTTAATPASDAELYSPSFNPLGTVAVTSSEATDSVTGACTLAPSTSTASTCASTVTPANVATSPHTITGTYPADAVHSASNSTASLTVTPDNTTTTITSNTPNPSAVNQAVSVSVSVTANAPGSGTPTGTVTVSDGVGQTCTITLSSGTGSCSLTPTAAGTDTLTAHYNGDANFNASTSNGVSQTVGAPPSISKAFSPTSIPLNGTSTLTFTITNPSSNVAAATGVAFSDTLPAGLIVTTPNGLTNSCGGTPSAAAGATSISLTGATVAVNSSCTVVVNITGTVAGVFTNTTGAVSSTNGGTGNTATAVLTVVAPPSIAKAFSPSAIPVNGTTTLTFTITNPAANPAAETGVAFSDTLPTGLVVATPNSLTNSCGGTPSATAGGTSISLTSGTIALSSSCTVVVNVTGTTPGSFTNISGPVSSTNGGTGNTATAALAVVGPPSIAKAFSPTTIAPNGVSTLTITLTNPAANTVSLQGVAFTDSFPANLVVATPNALTNSCGGTPTAVAGSGSLTLTGATIATNSSCTVVVNVTASVGGSYLNSTGPVSSTNGGTGATASATLNVALQPTVTKAFGAATVPVNGTTSLTITITNPNTTQSITGLAFTDNFPAGLAVAATPNLTDTCGGPVTAPAGTTSVSLTGGTLAASASCAVSLNVTGSTAGVKNNSVNVTSTNAGTSNTANASLTVTSPPAISKSFGAPAIPVGGSTSLSFTVQNPNASQSLSSIAFTDTLPAGLSVASPNGLTGSCGAGTITASAGTNAVSLSGATLAATGSCTFSVNVTGIAAGQQNNVTGAVTSTEGGSGGTASASISVIAPPVIAKAFNPASITPNATTSLTFTITNPIANTVALTGVAFTDNLPTGLTVAASSSALCGGTLTTAAPTGIALTGATIAASGQCQFSVTVTGVTPGAYTNTTGNVTSANGGTGNTASANLVVATPPVIAKAFGAASIGLGTSTSLTFTINNPNSAVAFTGVAFTDTLPPGLTVSTPNGLTGTCGTGTTTAAAGSQSITLAGGTIAASSSCTFSVNVTGVVAGTQVNTTGVVSAANGGTGNTATATVTVLASDLTIAKTHSGNFFQGQAGATYMVIVSNVGPGPTLGTVTVTEVPPAGLTVTSLLGTGWSCTIGTLTCTRADALAAGASYPAITVTVTVAPNAPSSVTNVVNVAGGGEVNLANDSASDVTTITAPPDFTITVAPASITIPAGQTATFNLTITPVNNAFNGTITLSATGLPPKTQIALSPSSVTPGANPASATLVIITSAGDPFIARNAQKPRAPIYAMFFPLAGLLLSGLGFSRKSWRKGKTGIALFALMVLCGGVALNGCASASNFNKLGTPPGSYTVSINAASGNVQHTAPATLVVQP